MSSSLMPPDPTDGPTGYQAVGFASIEITCSRDGVALVANADGLRSLARLFGEMAERSQSDDHIHLTQGMQLTASSEGFVVARRDDGMLPDGSQAPQPS